jgi:hypothetical protein
MSLEKFLENIALKLARYDNYIHQHKVLGSEVFPAMMMKSFILWDITSCSLSSLCYLLHAAFFFLADYSTLKLKATYFSETLVDFQRTIWHYMSEDRTLHEVVGWELTACHGVRVGERDLGCFGRWAGYQLDGTSIRNCEWDCQPWLTGNKKQPLVILVDNWKELVFPLTWGSIELKPHVVLVRLELRSYSTFTAYFLKGVRGISSYASLWQVSASIDAVDRVRPISSGQN